MILGPDGKPVDAEPSVEGGADPYESRVVEFRELLNRDIELRYRQARETLNRAYFGSVAPEPVKLTRRQWARVWWSRLRRSVARPLVRLADWISPGVSGEGCDC